MTDPAARLRQIAHHARSVSSALELEAVLDQVTAAVTALRPDAVCAIRLVDAGAGGYRLAGTGGPPVGSRMAVVPFGEGLTHMVAEGRQSLLEDQQIHPRAIRGHWSIERGMPVYLGVPIEAAGELLGVLNVNFHRSRPPSSDERQLIEFLAGQAAVAIRNARLFAEAQAGRRAAETLAGQNARLYAEAVSRRRQAEELARVARALTETLDVEELSRRIADAVLGLFDVQSAILAVARPDGMSEILASAGPASRHYPRGMRFAPGQGVIGRAFATGRAAWSDDVQAEAPGLRPEDLRRRNHTADTHAVLAVPLSVKGRVVGALSIADHLPRRFDDQEIGTLQAFADQAALALDNATLYSEAERRRREAEELARVARTLTESLDVGAVADRIVETVLRLFGAQSASLRRRAPDGSLVVLRCAGPVSAHFPPGHSVPTGVGLAGRVALEGQAIWTHDLLTDPRVTLRAGDRQHVADAGGAAALGVPLRVNDRLIGVLTITGTVGRTFAEADVTLLQTFADQAAVAIDNARLYAETHDALVALQAAQDELVRGETLRAIGQLAAGAAHHLNNRLTVALGRVQLAMARPISLDVASQLVVAAGAIRDVADVLRRLQTFAAGEPAETFEPVDLNQLADEVLQLTRPRWCDEPRRRGVTIDPAFERGDVPPVAGVPASLREVLANLVFNAVDAMPSGGRIVVRTWTSGPWVHCSVTDTGIGMSHDAARHAIEPFFTTKGVQTRGLGLSVSYGIVRRHGGDLAVESEPGRGTTITFRLPVTPAGA